MRVLVIEDEVRVARNIARVLREQAAFAVDVAHDGEDGQHLVLTNPYDLVILDLMLPRLDGLSVLRAIREKPLQTPVLVLTARDGRDEVVAGLDAGCDDYLTKPFDLRELLARCRALIRRCHRQAGPVLEVGPIRIDPASRQVTHKGKPCLLRAMEYRLLEYLAMRAGQVVSKEEITEHLYEFDAENFSNVIEVYVSSLRRRFDPDSPHRLIHTLRGQGYMLGERPQ